MTAFLRTLLLPALLLSSSTGCTLQNELRAEPPDPVCGRPVDRTKGVVLTLDGRRYYFDSEECRRKFEAHPARYFDPAQVQFYPEP